MKNSLISTIEGFWKYHFVIRMPYVEVWVEKFSGSFDTGHRLSLSMAYQNCRKDFQYLVDTIENKRWERK